MFNNRWRLFRLQGIPIYVDLSWLIILALVTWTLSLRFRAAVPGTTISTSWLLGLVTAVAFFVCIVLHELGHALTAQRIGIPMQGITLFLFGGVSEMGSQPPSAGKEFLMAIAGPIVSALLGFAFLGLALVGEQSQWGPSFVFLLGQLALINLAVLVFNLVPAFPLDGGRVLRAALWAATGKLRQATRWASLLGQGFAWFLIILGLFQLFQGAFVGGLWLAVIGLFLKTAAQASYQQVLIRQALAGEPVERFMNREPITVPPSLNLQHLVDDYIYRYHHKTYPVASDHHLEGIVSTRDLSQFPRSDWDSHQVREAMHQDVSDVSISPAADALLALEQMQRTDSGRLLVMDHEQLVGIVSRKDLLRFLQTKLDLEAGDDRDAGDSSHSIEELANR